MTIRSLKFASNLLKTPS